MGQAASRGEGKCGAPLGVDPRMYALTKIHGIPSKSKYLNMYPGYSVEKACQDIRAWRAGGGAVHAVTKFNKVLRGHPLGKARDPRMYVFTKVYRLSQREIDEIMHQGFYTADMALQEIHHQEKRKAGERLPQFRYNPSRSMRFTNAKHDFVYKQGRKGYETGFSYAHNGTSTAAMQINPKQHKSMKNVYAEAYKKGHANATTRHALAQQTSRPTSPAVSGHASASAGRGSGRPVLTGNHAFDTSSLAAHFHQQQQHQAQPQQPQQPKINFQKYAMGTPVATSGWKYASGTPSKSGSRRQSGRRQSGRRQSGRRQSGRQSTAGGWSGTAASFSGTAGSSSSGRSQSLSGTGMSGRTSSGRSQSLSGTGMSGRASSGRASTASRKRARTASARVGSKRKMN